MDEDALAQLIELSNLEVDHINPRDLRDNIQPYILPEHCVQIGMTVLFLFTGNWVACLLNLPLAVYHGLKIQSGTWKIDAATVFKKLKSYQYPCYVKLVFYLVTFFYYLYWCVWPRARVCRRL